ncbi:putative membrane protein [Asticcacaulis biprosthecium C19]|uniref:Putative membrane protein n=1 Tax=Asticcacaulis biprosthecium C19 TaxID=715226 RepID=F4QR73_9CAUL|nr:hypothetical protein [Asticcacaulis biprosthecium]EGF90710.1 putative membrane protein [Asticcacaulis biprosthecium C19]
MWILPRIFLSVLGAAAARAAAIGLMAYGVIGERTAISGFELASTMLSLTFFLSLIIAAIIGIPMFAGLIRRGRLRWWSVTWRSFFVGFVVVNLVGVALYGLGAPAIWVLVPLYALIFLSPYLILSPLAGLTALLVWKTFPANPWGHERQEPAA